MDDGRRVTMSAVARAAGVSVPTVSRVLNGHPDVSALTRIRVEAALRENGYRRRAARRSGRTLLVDVVFDDLYCPWAVEVIRGIEDVTRAAGIGTVVSAVHRAPLAWQRWLGNLRTRSAAGVIAANAVLSVEVLAELSRLRVPLVLVDPVTPAGAGVPAIGATNWAGALGATEHLIELGHRRIGFIGGPAHVLCSRARFDGYRAGLEAAGLEADPALIREGDFYHESGFAAATELLAQAGQPTALFAASDQMALGACEAVRRRGLRVPADVSVIGFDDVPEARWSSPPLTTVRQPLLEMGGLAARTVLRLAGDDGVVPVHGMELPTSLIRRGTTARI
ncbi:LacI family DNA-binding transcriptional regulator [Winogradskya humida]|uniref:LacI family transcriptional regulator n=1 Tax=Winogradskya humida TaxID=113566 RepID=A0ABQ3ZJB6_9ACTN|nr:substrate-binding domain-containing protein [Actinoplanes humidus]GIE18678.1 LacI family transcriptional regulator [Actinoplanes humidus]